MQPVRLAPTPRLRTPRTLAGEHSDASQPVHRAALLTTLSASLASRYRVEREIGRGGMATVFLARDVRHDSAVALKVLHPELSPLVASERFAREIKITAGLQHPNILPVLDSGDAGGLPFYTMPYVEGESLGARMRRERQMPIDEAMTLASEVTRALGYAHERGFVHRDIKPENILLSHGHAIVADFGVARAMDVAGGDRITESGLAVGTAMYMSPEQGAGDAVDGRSDQYSVACVLYEMLVGSPPFTGSTPQALLARHAVDPVPSIRTVRRTISPAIETVIRKAMSKTPADRYRSAEEFADALDAAASAQAGFDPRTPITGSVGISRRAIALVAGAAVVAIGVAAPLAWRRAHSAAVDPRRVTVFPFTVSPDFKGSPAVGEDIATVVGHSLDATGALRWVDGWRLIQSNDELRHGRIDRETARRLARQQHAGFYLTGTVLPKGADSVTVLVDLVNVANDSTSAGTAAGAASDAWRTGLRSVNTILAALVPGARTRDLTTDWTDRAPEAVAQFLLGESSFRRARPDEAISFYRAAVRADSTFAIAAVRGAQAATWAHRETEADSLIRRALAQPMSPLFTQFAIGYAAYLDGQADSAAAALRRALAIDPELAPAWMQLGEVYTHLPPASGRVDTLADVAFNEALRLDSTAVHALFHPIEIRLRRGDLAGARPLLARFLAAEPDTVLAAHVRVMGECVRKGPRGVDWRREVASHPLSVLTAAQSLAVAGAQIPCAEAAYTAERTYETPEMVASNPAADSRRWTALVGLTGVLLATGRDTEAMAHIDSAMARREGGGSLYMVGASLSPAMRAGAATAAQAALAQAGNACERCNTDRLWQLGVFAAHAPDSSMLRRLDSAFTARAATSADAAVPALATHARLLLLQGDTAAALETFMRVLASPSRNAAGTLVWTERLGRGPERLRSAQLWARRRDFRRALAVADVFDSPASQSFVAYLPASLELRAALADSAGMSSSASWYRGRLQALRASKAGAR